MPNISLTDPVTNTVVASGLIATNNGNLRTLLNGGLDYLNLKGVPALAAGEVPVWNGTQFDRSSVTKIASGSLAGIKNVDVDAAAAIAYSKMANPGGTTTFLRADGTFVVPSATSYDRATTTVDVATSITETSIYSKSIIGNDMSTNKMLRLTLLGDYLHNNVAGDTLTTRIKFGGTTFFANASNLGNVTGAVRQPWILNVFVANLGATNSQMISAGGMTTPTNTAAPTTGIGPGWFNTTGISGNPFVGGISTLGTIDTTANQTLDITVQWSASSANNSWRMRYAVLELI